MADADRPRAPRYALTRRDRADKEHIAYIGPERQDKYVRYGWNLTVAQVVTTGLFDEDIPLTQPSRAQRAASVPRVAAIRSDGDCDGDAC